MDFDQFSKSFDAAARICAWYAAEKERLGRDNGGGSLAAREGTESHPLTYAILDDLIDDEQMAALASSDKVRANVRGLIANFPYWAERHLFHHEIELGLTLDGKPVPRQGAPIGMTLDLLAIIDGVGVVIDLKTGQVRDDPMERHLYVLGLKSLCPDLARIAFVRVYPVGTTTWMYHWISSRKLEVWEVNDNPPPQAVFTARGRDPLLKVVLDRMDEIRAMPLKPNIGDHCLNVYGNSCPFIATTCSAAKWIDQCAGQLDRLPAVVASGVTSLPPDKAPGAAFLALLHGDPIERTPAVMSLAEIGVRQLRAGATAVHKEVVDYSRETGVPIRIGNAEYGWTSEPIIDTQTALRMMLRVMTFEDLAKRVHLSISEIEKIGDRKYPGLKEQIKTHCVAEGERQVWGKIKE